MESNKRTLVFDDVLKHNKTNDCWLIIPKAEDITMTLDEKTFTFDDVCKHNKNKECWLIIAGKVYDVTQFKDIHPGSDVMLLGAMGIDATKDHEEVAHSDEAKKMMEKYYVGKIDESTLPVKFKTNSSNNISQLIVNMLQFLVPFVILGMAFTVRAYTKEKSA